jgi:hypothetical protein
MERERSAEEKHDARNNQQTASERPGNSEGNFGHDGGLEEIVSHMLRKNSIGSSRQRMSSKDQVQMSKQKYCSR